MSSLTGQDHSKLKKLVRFLVGVKEVLWEYPWQEEREATGINIQDDSVWAGCERTRRSTSRGCITVGQHPLQTWSSTQSVVATSSAEAELCGMNEGASRGLGLQSMMLELGIEVKLFLMTDSAAAKSFSSTRGLRRMRHVEVQDLWLQELVQKGRLHVLKINGLVNVADTLTKYHDQVTCSNLLAGAGLRVVPVMIAHSQSEGVVLNDGATVTRPAGRKTRGRKVCECAHQTVSPLLVRAVWRSPIPTGDDHKLRQQNRWSIPKEDGWM